MVFNRDVALQYCKDNYEVLEHTIRKGHGNHSLKIAEFKEVGIRRVMLCGNLKSTWIEFWSTDDIAIKIADSIEVTLGERSASHGVWKSVKNADDTLKLLREVMHACINIDEKDVAEEFNRNDIESKALSKLNYIEKAKYDGFWEVAKKINSHVGSIFHVDHASSIKDAKESSIRASNLQLLVKGINTSKNSSSWDRMDWVSQKEHVLVNAKLVPNTNIEYIDFLLEQLKLYWD